MKEKKDIIYRYRFYPPVYVAAKRFTHRFVEEYDDKTNNSIRIATVLSTTQNDDVIIEQHEQAAETLSLVYQWIGQAVIERELEEQEAKYVSSNQ